MFLKDSNNKKKSHKNLPMLPFLMLSAPSCRSRFPYGIIFLGPEGHSLTFLIVGLVVMKILKDIFHWDIILIFFQYFKVITLLSSLTCIVFNKKFGIIFIFVPQKHSFFFRILSVLLVLTV